MDEIEEVGKLVPKPFSVEGLSEGAALICIPRHWKLIALTPARNWGVKFAYDRWIPIGTTAKSIKAIVQQRKCTSHSSQGLAFLSHAGNQR